MKYMKIGGKFHLGVLKEAWGPVVASSEAFFLIPQMQQSAGGVGAGAAVAGAISEATASALRNTRSQFKTQLENFPEDTSHPDWPIEMVDGLMFRVPKEACTFFKYSWFAGITLKTTEHKFRIAPTAGFFPKGTKRFLEENGWLGIRAV